MLRKGELQLLAYRKIKSVYESRPSVQEIVEKGDRLVYGSLNPLEERAFDYRDSIDITNHFAGIEATKALVPAGSRILYLASSYGLGPLLLSQIGYNVVCLDRDFPALVFAKQFVKGQVYTDATNLPFVSSSFDAVISRDFLARDYHLLSRQNHFAIASEIQRVLGKEGLGIFYTLYTSPTEVMNGLPYKTTLNQVFRSTYLLSVRFGRGVKHNTAICVTTK